MTSRSINLGIVAALVAGIALTASIVEAGGKGLGGLSGRMGSIHNRMSGGYRHNGGSSYSHKNYGGNSLGKAISGNSHNNNRHHNSNQHVQKAAQPTKVNPVQKVADQVTKVGNLGNVVKQAPVAGGIVRPQVPAQVLQPVLNSGVLGSKGTLPVKNLVGSGNPSWQPHNWPVGPIKPVGQGQPFCGTPNPPVCQPNPCPPTYCPPKWNWVVVPVYPAGGYHNVGYCRPTVINNTTVIEQKIEQPQTDDPAVAQPAAPAVVDAPDGNNVPDLELKNVVQIDAGNLAAELGPVYRVVIENASNVDIDRPFIVTLIAAQADNGFDAETPRSDEPVARLAAGETIELDVRLPASALTAHRDAGGLAVPFANLLVVVDSYANLPETNRDNNAAALARVDIEALLPFVSGAEAIANSGSRELQVAGQSFGVTQGKVLLDLGAVRVPAEVVSWEADAIRAKLPALETAASVTTRLVIVRADGTAAEPFDLTPANVAAK